MTRRKIVGASLFFTLFGAIAIFPPVIWLFNADTLIFGVPLEVLYIFGLWIALVIGALRFAAVLPPDEASTVESWDKDQ